MKNKLLIIGASGHGKVVADIAMKVNQWDHIAFLDDDPSMKSSMGLNVIGNSKEIPKYSADYDIVVGIGNNETRQIVHERLEKAGATIPILLHPSAVIGEQVQIKNGTVVMAGAIINSSTNIGKGCIINTGSTIDHDNNIKDYVHISPGANLAGAVTVGQCSWIGIGSSISNNVNISSDCTIGAGGVVVKDIIEAGTYIGVPAKKLK